MIWQSHILHIFCESCFVFCVNPLSSVYMMCLESFWSSASVGKFEVWQKSYLVNLESFANVSVGKSLVSCKFILYT